LCGIKWRKLLYTETVPYASSEPLEDPVLSSFSKCLAADILCVWRRVQAPKPPPPPMPGGGGYLMDPMQAATMGPGGFQHGQRQPPQMMPPAAAPPPAPADPNTTLSLHSSKELWIFWYGEEPDLSSLVALDQLVSGESHFYNYVFQSIVFLPHAFSSLQDCAWKMYLNFSPAQFSLYLFYLCEKQQLIQLYF
jgi:mediator of RNA polymerase II transcription subunit 13